MWGKRRPGYASLALWEAPPDTTGVHSCRISSYGVYRSPEELACDVILPFLSFTPALAAWGLLLPCGTGFC